MVVSSFWAVYSDRAAIHRAQNIQVGGDAGDQIGAVEFGRFDDGGELGPEGREFLIQRGIGIAVKPGLTGLDRLRLHLGEKVGDGGAGVDRNANNGLAKAKVSFNRRHPRDIAPHVLGDGEGGGIVFGTINPQTGGNPELGRRQHVGGFGQALERDHCSSIGINRHNHFEKSSF